MSSLLEELSRRRERECRLTPDRALRSLDEAHAFLRDRGMLTRTTDSSLPSLYEASHEDPYAAGSRDAGASPTKWDWAAELAERPDVHALKIHRSKTILLTDETLALADPICRGELTRMENEDLGWNRLLTHLARTGPSDVDDVRRALGLKAQEMKALRYPLERCGALVGLPSEHGTLLARWDQAFPPAPHDGLSAFAALLAAAIRAAVLAPERELIRWFSWPWLFPDDLVDRLTGLGTLYRPAPGWVAASD